MEENSLRVLGKGVLLFLSKGKKWIELEMELRIGQSSPKRGFKRQCPQTIISERAAVSEENRPNCLHQEPVGSVWSVHALLLESSLQGMQPTQNDYQLSKFHHQIFLNYKKRLKMTFCYKCNCYNQTFKKILLLMKFKLC